jgi:exodeoxyribonuclease V gamma subunit
MFYLYQHHDLTALAELFAALRQRHTRASVLTPETVVVPNRGTARWLQAELAEAEGAAANLELPVPGRFVWQTLRDTLPGSPDSAQYEREALVWHLYALLPSVEVAEVQRYLAREPRERQRYQLAQQLAAVFDQYLIHRRDVLAAWEAGAQARLPPESWQAPVWRALVERLETGFDQRDRAKLLTELLERAQAGTLDDALLPSPLYAFGLVDLPADYLRLLHALGRYTDVHYLLPNPSGAYWGDVVRKHPLTPALSPAGGEGADDETRVGKGVIEPVAEPGHPLLASLGRAGRDFLRVLYSDELDAVVEPDLGEAFAYTRPTGETLLARVQAGIVSGEAPSEDAGAGAGDASIQIHACHGPMREMQVLHDRLLDRLAREPELEPRAILVLLPDVSRYAPAVHSVFGATTGAGYIPYSVSDRPRHDTHPIAQTFRQLLDLPLWRWTASDVLALAGVPAVMRRFGLDEADWALLQQWIAAAGVRWGLDAATREALGSAGFEQNTWRFGLDRLLLGLSQRDPATLVDGVAPWSDLEGGAGAAVGRLWALLERLRHWRDRFAHPDTAAAWQERLNAMVTDLFTADPGDAAEQAALTSVFEATATLTGAADALGGEPLSWEAVREALVTALAGAAERQPLVSGGVTFTGLEPLRGVPFDVICMVGLDDGVFPRQDGQSAFNLMRQQPRAGDPSVRDTDRMAFLQGLTGARRCFYLSYNGRSVTDGTPREPSPVVAEFLDYLHGHHFAGWSRAAFAEAVVIEQPMQPFSARYFRADEDRLSTFADAWRPAAAAQRGERAPPAAFVDDTRLPTPEASEPIDLAALQRFFAHPAAWFFQERLGLQLGEPDTLLADDEPRGLDSLQTQRLRERLFETAKRQGLQALDPEPGALERAQGALPPPPLGAAEHAQAAAQVNAVLPLYWRWQAEDDGADTDIDLVLDDGTRILGQVPAVGRSELRRLRPGRLHLKHLLRWWLAYLAVAASGRDIGLRVAGVGDAAAVERAGAVAPETARRLLATATGHYREGHARALLFEPYLADSFLEHCARGGGKSPDAALDDLNGRLVQRYSPHRAAADPWLEPLFAPSPSPLGTDAAGSTLVRVTDDIVRPLYEHLPQPAPEATP